MKFAFSIGLLVLLALGLAAVDNVQTYRDASCTLPGTVFKNGATVYVRAWDGVSNGNIVPPGMSYQVHVKNNITTDSIDFFVNDANADGNYTGFFKVSSNATNNAEDVNNLYAANAQLLIIGAPTPVNLDGQADGGTLFEIITDYVAPDISSCNVTPNATWLAEGQNFTVTLRGEDNGTAWFTYNNMNVSLQRVEAGVYSLNYTVKVNESHKSSLSCFLADEAGNENTTTTSNELWVDTTAPIIKEISPGLASWTNNNFSDVLFNVTDAASGVANVIISATQGNYSITSVNGINYTATTNEVIPDGNITITVNATDNVGNNASSSWYFTVDTVAPYFINFTSPANTTYTSTSVDFIVTPYDSMSPEIECTYEWYHSNGTRIGVQSLGWISNATTSVTQELFTDGNYYANYRCNDRAQNSVYGALPNFTVDTTPPAITLDLNDSYLNSSDCVEISGKASDELSMVANITVYVNGTAQATTWDGENYSSTVCLAGWAENDYLVNVTANDSVGNLGFSLKSFTVDNTKPSITPIMPVNGTVYNNSILDYNAISNELCEWWRFCVFNPSNNNTSCDSSHYFSGSLACSGTLSDYRDGDYLTWFECTDMAGNTNKTENLTITVNDTTPPEQATGLTAIGGIGKIDLSWNAPLGANDKTIVYVSTTDGGPYTLLATTAATNYSHTGLGSKVTRYYIVGFVDLAGNKGMNSTQVSATTLASRGSMGSGSSSQQSSSTPKKHYDDPPEAIELPIVLPTPEDKPEPVQQVVITGYTPQEKKPNASAPQYTPSPTNPMTGFLFKDGSFLFGFAALLALTTIWILWSASKVPTKTKWYEN